MASKILPVCSREWGAYGIITGYIAEPRDAESLAGKLLRLVDDSDKEKKFQSELMNMYENRHGKKYSRNYLTGKKKYYIIII